MPQNFSYILISILAIIFVFLFAVQKFSNQVQKISGEKFKDKIRRITDKPWKGTLVGTFVTAILQSSTAVTVMVVSLVHAGTMPFINSLGVIFGANIGTTITTQLVALQILNLAPFILIFGFLLSKIKNKYQNYGKPIFYFGLIFSCLFLISALIEPLKTSPQILDLLSRTSGVFASVLMGLVFSTILQSSSVVSAIAVVLAGGGLIGLSQAFAIILGSNIGTTTTTLIASLALDKQAKRSAMAHFLFNLIGVILIMPFFGVYISGISFFGLPIMHEVALSHFLFNLLSAILALIFIKPFCRLVVWLVR